MYRIDPTRTDLAIEFRNKPFGLHSPELHAVLTTMRRMPVEGKHILIATKPHEEWRLAIMTGKPLRPAIIDGPVFTSPVDAEWVVFKLRWQALTGETLNVD